ncbi:LOW QUALITY PROTEIN: Hypothetical protein PHPALM_38008, partial [Phytophthora palmivora]
MTTLLTSHDSDCTNRYQEELRRAHTMSDERAQLYADVVIDEVENGITEKLKTSMAIVSAESKPVTRDGGKEVKLGCSPSLKPVRDERSSYCIYAYVEKQSEATVNQLIDPIDNTCDFLEKSMATVSSLRQIDEYARSSVMMALEISPEELRDYWKYHVPDKKFKQSKLWGRSTTKKQLCYLTVVSILDATFARKVGCHIDESQTLDCEGVGRSPYKIEGRTRLKITLAGSLVYFFDAWVGPPTGGQDLILGMDFMVPAGIRLDFADGTICLPDEVRLQRAGRRPLCGDKIEHVCWKDHYWID